MKKIKKLLCMMLAVLLLAFSCAAAAGAEEPVQPDMKALHQQFIAYLDEQGIEHDFEGEDLSSITFITKINDWSVFYGTRGWAGAMFTSDGIGRCVFVNPSWEAPYKIGLYAEKEGKVLTLKEAYNTGEIDIKQVVEHIDAIDMFVFVSGDIDANGEMTVSDVLEVQKAIAKYSDILEEDFLFPFYDYDGNGVIEIKDVLDMQKKIAKITE